MIQGSYKPGYMKGKKDMSVNTSTLSNENEVINEFVWLKTLQNMSDKLSELSHERPHYILPHEHQLKFVSKQVEC